MSTNPQVGHNDDGLWIPAWNFSDRIRRIRREVGVSQDVFANALQVKKVTLGAWESGRTQPRDLVAVAKRIELAFRVPAAWTLGVNAENRRLDDPSGGSAEVCTPRDLNPEPTD
ncbi:helix-turn-helix domain-containing protein [Brevibacterium sediminis]|uniref:helix-turn-helix domain-containing protein n=1 Tax=Brevibacterium sediminis TaxID=1857024 RepID=UPI0035BE870B